MTVYWLLFAVPALFALSGEDRRLGVVAGTLLVIAWTAVVGFRNEVGADWWTYVEFYEDMASSSLFDIPLDTDIGYAFLNWLIGLVGGGIYSVNLICGLIFAAGAIAFARQQPRPWLAISVIVPYLLIVVAMGYTRQGVALGFLFFALAALTSSNNRSFFAYVVAATLFHRSAIVMLPLPAFAKKARPVVSVLIFAGLALVALLINLFDYVEALYLNYILEEMESAGGLVRLALNSLPAVLCLAAYRTLNRRYADMRIWLIMSVATLSLLPFVVAYSTAVDRVALYLAPLQVAIFSRAPDLSTDRTMQTGIAASVLLLYGAVLWTWLNYAIHAIYWIPYSTFLSG